jgi:BirA family biotin operon repressor/biotin-[acetyl-CoA-carboxylase] ligase
MSIGTTDHIDPSRRSFLLTALGLAAIDACESVTGFRPSLKWPNDLVARPPGGGVERKLGGILAEAQSAGNGVATVVGLGLNCNWISGDGPGIPEELSEIAISLDQLSEGPVDREALMVAIVQGFERNLARLSSAAGVESLLDEARANSATLGREVRIELGKTEFVGTASDVDAEGALLVTDPTGKVHRVVVGDVVHLRPIS